MTVRGYCKIWHSVIKANPALWESETTPIWTQVDFEVVTFANCKVCHSTIGRKLERAPLVTSW